MGLAPSQPRHALRKHGNREVPAPFFEHAVREPARRQSAFAMAQLSVETELAKYGPHARRARRPTPAEARAYCRALARSHQENFTVASRLLPRRLLPHFYAIYAYCRWADDLADEVGDADQRLALLDWWHAELDSCYAGVPAHPVFVALRETIEEFSIPSEPFARLLTAFRQDQRVTRYATPSDVLAYCRNSADPVGRLILYLGRCHDPRLTDLADSICTGLQLTNFCQDVARDWTSGRIYLPRVTLERFGYTDAMFARRTHNDAFRNVMREEVDRAEQYLFQGRPLIELMPAELRLEVALFIAGGLSILRAIRRQDYNVWRARPTLSRWQKLSLVARCWWRIRGISSRERP